MKSDTADRLIAWADPIERGLQSPAAGLAMRDAAKEIKRLRAALREVRVIAVGLMDGSKRPELQYLYDVAREALGDE